MARSSAAPVASNAPSAGLLVDIDGMSRVERAAEDGLDARWRRSITAALWLAWIVAEALAHAAGVSGVTAFAIVPVVVTAYWSDATWGTVAGVAVVLAMFVSDVLSGGHAPADWTVMAAASALIVASGAGAGWIGRTKRELAATKSKLEGNVEQLIKQTHLQLQAHMRLEANNERMQAMIEAIPIPIFELDPQGNVRSFNQAASRLFGYTNEDLHGQQPKIVPPEELKSFQQILSQEGTSGRIHHDAIRVAKDGERIPVDVYSEKLPGGGFVRALVDLRPQKQARAEEARAQQQSREFQDLLDHLDDAYFVANTDDGSLTISQACQKIYGVSPEAFAAYPDMGLDMIHPDHRDAMEEAVDAAQRGQEPVLTYRIVRPDGAVRWVRTQMRCHREAGRVVGVRGVTRDVTHEHDLMTEKSRRAEEGQRFKELMDSMDAVYTVHDIATGEVLVSEASTDILGVRPDEVREAPDAWQRHIHPDDLEKVAKALFALQQEPHSQTFDFRRLRADGSVRDLRSTLRSHADAKGQVVRIDGVTRDVTIRRELDSARAKAEAERLEAEKLREMDQFKTTFLNTAAHELSTPLTPIRLQMSMLLDDFSHDLPPDGHAAIEVMDRSVSRLEALVRDLLDASRLDSGTIEIHRQAMSLRRVLEDIDVSFGPQAHHAGIELAVQRPEIELEADANRITQVMTNLVHNAIKFTPTGGRVEVRARKQGDEVVIEVQDTGMGLTAQAIEGLFQPFAQFHRDQLGAGVGTGLGLYISKGIIEEHGGSIECTSPGPGLGARFTVRIPRRVPLSPTPSA